MFDKTHHSGYVYDAVWLYALALERLVQEDETYLQNLHSNRLESPSFDIDILLMIYAN